MLVKKILEKRLTQTQQEASEEYKQRSLQTLKTKPNMETESDEESFNLNDGESP